MNSETLWLGVGFLGQGIFSLRFLVQWWRSELEQRSVVPSVFWHFSLLGGSSLLLYAVHRRDPVFIAGQLLGLFVYGRNLHFIARSREHPDSPGDPLGEDVLER